MKDRAQRKAGRRDVARLAGVSLTTVTHALNGTPGKRVRAGTVEKVRKAALELGYLPNFHGRALVSGRTFTAGLIQPSRLSVFYQFYQEIIIGMVEAMEPDDYNLLLMFRSEDPGRFMRPIEQGRVDGAIVLQSDMDAGCVRQVLGTGIPTVLVNARIELNGAAPFGNVCSDHDSMIRDVLDEFVSLGCKSVLAVHDYTSCSANRTIFESFVKYTAALAKKEITGTTLVPNLEEMRLQMGNLFRSGQRYDGIYVDNPGHADMVHEEAVKAGLRAGRDFHLITSGLHKDAHTAGSVERCVFNQQPYMLGTEAWHLLKGLIAGEKPRGAVLVPYSRIEINHSTKKGLRK